MEVVCEQHRDGVQDEHVTPIPALEGERPEDTLERKRQGAIKHGWTVDSETATSFHAWKEYDNGMEIRDRPSRKDRYFEIV